jgi:hypothetical protein
MSMRPKLWTISALGVELGVDRRTLASKLADVPADGKSGSRDAWRLTTVLAALGWGRPKRTKGARIAGSSDYERWRARWMRQRALDAERESKVRQRELVELVPFRDAMIKTWKRMMLLARNRFFGFPSKLASHFPIFDNQADIFTWSTGEVRKILQLLADTKPVAFEGPYQIPRYETEEDVDHDEDDNIENELASADAKSHDKSGA